MHTIPDLHRRGFALKELLVTLLLIALLVGLLIPGIQRLRESSRRAGCLQNLATLGLGLDNYSLTFTHFPAGSLNPTGPIRNVPDGFHHNWIEGILPSLDYPAIYEMIDHSVSVYAPENADAMAMELPVLRCPSATMVDSNASNYAGVHHPTETPIDTDNWGMFILNRSLNEDDVPDGLSTTLLVGEKLQRFDSDLGWLSGTRATLRNLGHPLDAPATDLQVGLGGEAVPELFVGGFVSDHPSGVAFLHGDRSVRVVAPTADMRVLQQLADRRDSLALAEPELAEPEVAEPEVAEPEAAAL